MNLPHLQGVLRGRQASIDLKMKKAVTAVLTVIFSAVVLSACGSEASENAESVSDTASVKLSETTLETVCETIATETDLSTVQETTATETLPETELTSAEAETEETTTAETTEKTTEAKSGGTYAADKSSLVGTWYAINSEKFDGLTYIFGEDGTVTAFDAYEKQSGTYTVKNGLLELTLPYEGEDYIQSVAAVVDGGILVIDLIGLNTELIREEYEPYTEDMSIYDYFHEVSTITYPIFFSKERSILAEQKDVLGEWTVYENGEAVGKCVFNEDSMTEIRNDNEETMPIILKGGRTAFSGEIPENLSLSDDIVSYLCGGKLYTFDNVGFPTIFEKSK
ncbi:MAG: hypothetical protein ACI4SF_02255 [Oscillospiraceae bacterium]